MAECIDRVGREEKDFLIKWIEINLGSDAIEEYRNNFFETMDHNFSETMNDVFQRGKDLLLNIKAPNSEEKLYNALDVDSYKDKLKISRGKNNTVATKNLELDFITKLQKQLIQYKYTRRPLGGCSAYLIQSTRKMHCHGATMIASRFLDELNIKHVHMDEQTIGHSSMLVQTADENIYFQDYTPGDIIKFKELKEKDILFFVEGVEGVESFKKLFNQGSLNTVNYDIKSFWYRLNRISHKRIFNLYKNIASNSDIDKSLKIEILKHLGSHFLEHKNNAEAIKVYKYLYEINPTFDCGGRLAQAYEVSKDYKNALEIWYKNKEKFTRKNIFIKFYLMKKIRFLESKI